MRSLDRHCPLILALVIGLLQVTSAVATCIEEQPVPVKAETHETRTISGWVVKINKKLLEKDRESTEKALTLLKGQLDEVKRVVPAEAFQALRKVTIWVSPEYPGVQPRAEYHPGPEWLRENGRDPAMAKGIEITCIRDYESECKRMPMWMLHELAHAYHYQVLGVDQPDIRAAYEKAKASHKYDKIERRFADGKTRIARAYALTNAQEYFAECSEAFFGVNDWFPYTLPELQKHDPLVVGVLQKVWKVQPDKTQAPAKPLQVFILAGQSNMEGQGFIKADPKRNEGKGSLEHLIKDPAKSDKFKHLLGKDGKWAVSGNVWIHDLERKGKLTVGYGAKEDRIGPELGFGHVIGEAYQEPVLLIKLAWGGKSLAKDFRPPSSGGEVGPYYKEIIQRTKDVLGNLQKEFPEFRDRKYELAGFAWHQGWNDRVNQAFNDEYEKNLANFIRDIRKDLGVKNLPFVIAETGMSGKEEKHPRALSLMKAQAAVAEFKEFKGNVAFVGTREFWREKDVSPTGQAYHWNNNAETYYLIGEAMGNAMKKLCSANRG